MQWWNEFLSWLGSPDGRQVAFEALVFAIAIIVSGLIAAAIGRSAVKRTVGQRDREQRTVAIAALIDAATEATVWNSLSPAEQIIADRAVGQADIQVRLLPVKGATIAADWASHQLAEMKRVSATYGYELDPVIAEFRDRLLDWQERPGKAKKVFQSDLDRWTFADADRNPTVSEQETWVAQRHHQSHSTATQATTEENTTDASSAPQQTRTDPRTQQLIDDVAALNKKTNTTSDQTPPAAHGPSPEEPPSRDQA